MPCSMCHDFRGVGDYILKGESVVGRKYRHHFKLGFSWSDLEISAASCEICGILMLGCQGCFRRHGIEESQILHCHLSFYYESHEDGEGDVDKEIFFRMKDGSWFTMQVFASPNDEYPVLDAWESIPAGWNRTSPRTNSDEAFEVARAWIEDCLSGSHKLCESPQSPPLPTRVVDIGLLDDVVKLIEPEGGTGKYFCLSHCWGSEQIITTTRANLQVHKREIPLNLLPKTFRDAVLLTRRLGIAYIWIDSLCIVQDDNSDWKVESAKMERIYRNAHLTIAATRSSSGAGGLYAVTPDFEVSGVSSLGENYSLFFREKIDHHTEYISGGAEKMPGQTDDREDIGRPTIARHPLLTRAWVFQERLLSTRVLHFGPYELFFECRTSIECECNGIGYGGSSEAMPTVATKLLYADVLAYHKLRQRLPASFGDEQHWVSRLWRTLVSSYTALRITKPHDRLPAIGGLAKSLRSEKASAYLAGLWQGSLSDDLLWVIQTTSKDKRPRPRPRSAPTWSWASVDTSSLYFDEVLMWHPDIWIIENLKVNRRTSKHLADVVSCTVDLDGVDEFGVVSRGRLKISGAVSEGTLEREVEIHRGECNIIHCVLFPGVRLPLRSDYLLDNEGVDQVIPGTKVFSLRMSIVREGASEVLVSLVLRPSAINSTMFERIGTLLIYARPPPVDVNSGIYNSAVVRTVTIK